jgi:PAS domain S-box-containing protein
MGERMAAYDWASTPLGPPEGWPLSLRAVVRLLLTSRYAMWLGWGPDLIFFYNDAYAPTLGVKQPCALGTPTAKLWEEIWPDVGPRIDSVLTTGVATYDEGLLLFLERSGFTEETYHTFSYSPLFDDEGAIAGMFCVVVEETERLIGERRLRTLRELAAGTAEARTIEAACRLSAQALLTNRNDVPYALLYLTDEDGQGVHLVAASGLEPPHPAAPERVRLDDSVYVEVGEAVRSGHAVLRPLTPQKRAVLPPVQTGWPEPPRQSAIVPLPAGDRTPNGLLVVALNPCLPLDEGYHSFLGLLAAQISAAIANAQARDNEERLRQAVRATGIGIWDVHPMRGQRIWSEEFYAIMGMDPGQEADTDVFSSLIHPEDRERVERLYAEAYAAPEKGRYSAEFRVRRASDGAERWVRTEGLISYDSDGQPVRGTGALLDITERRLIESELEARVAERTGELAAANRQLTAQIAERERVEEALRRSQRLEAVGQLTSGVAHDFNNLLTVILGNIGFLMRGADEETSRRLEMMRSAAMRGASLTGQLLAFSRRQRLDAKRIDLNEAVESMRELLQSTLGGGIRISTELSPDLWPAQVDPTQYELVVLNLAINARDAMGVGGSLTVRTANVSLGEPMLPEDPPAGDYVVTSITDTGSGMTEEVLAKAFEPFFTTKEPGKGSGLGLAQVFGFARQSGGGVKITTQLGGGTTVAVFLPRARRLDSELRTAPEPANPRPRDGVRVLVVDDDSAVRDVTSAVLREHGYVVEEAGSGAGALELLTNGAHIDAVVADYAMPGMNGVELAQHARSRRPDLPIVFLTGYVDTDALSKAGERFIVQKPFQIDELVRRVQAALDGAEA